MSSDGIRLVRARSPRVMTGPSAVWLVDEAGKACLLEGDSAALVLALLCRAERPISQEQLVRDIAREGGIELSERQPIDDAVALLRRTGALVVEPGPAEPPAPPFVVGNVLVGVTGAVASAFAPAFVQRLVSASHRVRVVMTRSARNFVTPRTFEALTHRPVVTSVWRGTPSTPAPHIELAEWPDVVVVYPCTATTLARIHAGDCSELVSAVATTTRAPVLLVPSMNHEMFRAPRVAANLEQLRENGFFVAHPADGYEVADAPGDRTLRFGAAARGDLVHRYVSILLARAAARGPRLLTRAEWDREHAERRQDDEGRRFDPDIARLVERGDSMRLRVLDVGTGSGEVARAFARSGHSVVATDFSEAAIERAYARSPDVPVTWLVDDATETRLRGAFDLCIDRACFGCIPPHRRGAYLRGLAGLVRPGGAWLLKVYGAPLSNLRAYGFNAEEVRSLVAPWFDVVSATPSMMSFANSPEEPAWTFELARKAR